jgi:hypothetical protein
MDLRRTAAVGSLLVAISGCFGGGGGGDSSNDSGSGVEAGSVPLYVLIGGSSKPTGVGSSVFLDNGNARLDPGELFILPRNPLEDGATYRVSVEATVGGTNFDHTWHFTTTATPSPATGSVRAELNNFRAQAGSPAVAAHAALTEAATLHAGYQCEVDAITHGEADNSAEFFVHNDFFSRISIANGGTANSDSWPGGSDIVYETIATNGDEEAVMLLWNTVYHRLPMMRRHTTLVGSGDRSDAFAHARNSPQVIAANDIFDFMTLDYCADSSIAQIAGHWPSDDMTGAPNEFDSDDESPDPVDSGNANGTPDDDAVGTPIHVVVPSTGDFTFLTVSVRKL